MGTVKTAMRVSWYTMLIAVALSTRLIAGHLTHYKKRQQLLVILIILMVPLYAVDSYISLSIMRQGKVEGWHTPEALSLFLDAIKECYEAVVIYAFLQLMFDYVGVVPGKEVPDDLKGEVIHQTFPFNYFLADMRFDRKTADRLEMWAYQFVVLRPILSLVVVGMELAGVYEEMCAWLPISVLLNISVTLAVYALMLFYHAFADKLNKGRQRPLAKFICIKGVVFFTFWQGILLQGLCHAGLVKPGHFFSDTEKSTAVQHMLVCLEMAALFAPLHAYAFSYSDYAGKPLPASKHKKTT